MRQNCFVTLRNRVRDLQGCTPFCYTLRGACLWKGSSSWPKHPFISGSNGTKGGDAASDPPAARRGIALDQMEVLMPVAMGLGLPGLLPVPSSGIATAREASHAGGIARDVFCSALSSFLLPLWSQGALVGQ